MKFLHVALILMLHTSLSLGITLQNVFDAAGHANGYDKYVVLEQNVIYTGEVGVYEGNVFIEDKLDLHGFNEIEANNLLEDFINRSIENGKRLVLVITGKGKEGEGVIKNNIISWLNNKSLRNKILAVNHASKKHGGSGAIYILLRKF